MAGRNRMPRHPADFTGFRGGPGPLLNRGPGAIPVHPVALEEEVEFQHRELEKIFDENNDLADENMILKREVVATKDEIVMLAEHLMRLRADKDSQNRELSKRNMKMDADLRASELLREEVIRLRDEAHKLNALRQDLTVQIQGLSQDITRLRPESKQLNSLRADVDAIRQELADARRILEHEKKANEEQMVQKQAIEKDLISMSREMQKLRTEQLSTDRRTHGFGGNSYGTYNGNPDSRYLAQAYGDGYGATWGRYESRDLLRH